jgi:Tfp pilus assembly protein PilO
VASKAAAVKTPAAAPPSQAAVKRDTKANNYVAIVAVITVLIVLLCGFFAKALIGSIIINGKLILDTNQAKNDLDTKLKNIPILIDNYNSLGSKQQLIADALPSTADFPGLVSIAQAMSSDSGVTLKSISPDASGAAAAAPATASPTAAAPSSSQPTPYQFDVEIVGTYSQVVQYFQDVELSARPMKVISTQLSGDGTALQVSSVLQTYYEGSANTADQTETLK